MSTTTADYYSVLGVEPTASQEEVRAAYRRLAKQFHPDVNPDGAEAFRLATDAYRVLSDPEMRERYDAGDSGLDEDSLSAEDLEAYFRAVRTILGEDDLLDVGPVDLRIQTGGRDLGTAVGMLFVGPRAAVFIDSRARTGNMRDWVAPVQYDTLRAHPEMKSSREGTLIRLDGHDDVDYTAYIIGDAPFLSALQAAASAAFRAKGRTNETTGTYVSVGSRVSLGRIIRWILTTLFILGLIGKVLTATGAASESSSASVPAKAATESQQAAAVSEDLSEGAATDESPPEAANPWKAAKAGLVDYSSDLPGRWSVPVPGAIDGTAVAVQVDDETLVAHFYQGGRWREHGDVSPDVGVMNDVTLRTVDTSGQGGKDILVQFDDSDGERLGTVIFNTGDMATFTDEEGEYGFVYDLDFMDGELAIVYDGEVFGEATYVPGQGTFELTYY